MSDGVSRRYFFYGSFLSGAIPAGGYGSAVSLKAAGYKPFNEKLNIAGIGVGGQGAGDLNGVSSENIVALCDVDSRRASASFRKYEKAARYTDFRKMLDKEEKNIDACVIAVPDHMHTTIAIWCMQRGKHVYVEKPLSRTPWEARLLADAALKYKVATQMGNQGYSHEALRTAAEILWSGEIGNVTEVHAATTAPSWPQDIRSIPQPEAVPEGLDWDLWLGCATYRPYTSGGWDKDAPTGSTGGFYLPFNWRGFYDFASGALGDFGIHCLGPVHHALQLTMPTSIEVVHAEETSKSTYPVNVFMKYNFPARGNMPPVTINWYDGCVRDDFPYLYRPKGLENEPLLPPMENLAKRGRPNFGAVGGGTAADRGPTAALGASAAPLSGPGAFSQKAQGRRGILAADGAVFVGDKGLMATVMRSEGVWLLPAARWAEYKLPSPILPRSPGHQRDWIRACKGGVPACSDFSIAAPFVEWVTLGAIAQRFGQGKLMYDAKAGRFTNNQEANQYLKPVYRKGWELKL